jgi:hypothetical protein
MARILQADCCGFELFCPALLGEQATTAQVKNAVIKRKMAVPFVRRFPMLRAISLRNIPFFQVTTK